MTEMTPVNSSYVESLGWENDTMIARFKNGNTYAYYGISYDTFQAILESPSVGSALRSCGTRGQAC